MDVTGPQPREVCLDWAFGAHLVLMDQVLMQQMNFMRCGNLERKRKAHGKVGPLPRGGLLSLGVIEGAKRFYKFKKAGSATCKALMLF